MLNDTHVSKIKIDDRQTLISDDQIRKIPRSREEFSVSGVDKKEVEPVKNEQATKIVHVGDYTRPYQRTKNVVGYGLRNVFHSPDQIYFISQENETMRVTGDREYKTMMGVMIVMGLNQSLSQRIDEKNAIICDLTTKLEVFERRLSFESKGLDLPDDYYDDDYYLVD